MEPRPERRKQAERTAAARAKLIGATIGLIAERGLEGFSIKDVTERAGVSRGLPGHHFKSREGLIAAVASVLLRPPSLPDTPGLADLMTSLRRSLERAEEGSARIRAFLAFVAAPHRTAPTADQVGAYSSGATKFVAAHLEASKANGELYFPGNTADLAALVVGLVIGQAVASLPRGVGEPRPTTTEAFIALIAKGLGAVLSAPTEGRQVQPAARPAKAARSSGPPKGDAPVQQDLFPSAVDDWTGEG